MNISQIVLAAFDVVKLRKDKVVRLLLVPIMMVVGLGAIPQSQEKPALTMVISLMEVFLYASIAVCYERLIEPQRVSEHAE